MEYDFREIEKKWQKRWAERGTYRVKEDPSRPKYYVLDMFPYPSGAGLHVGHPLGYIASDIYTRYKRLKGFNVLHPMGYDAFGLPAEQYAIQTGQHPAVTTERNIARYREQLDKIGFSFDWDREVRTCDPKYYHWTQWAFLKMFGSYYSYDENRAMPIERLVEAFDRSGTEGLNVACTKELSFTAARWKAMDEAEREGVLQNYRLAFRADTLVNWCPELGTVLANDEVKDGLSVRGGYPVVQKRMKQWLLRVTAYAQRMLDGLDTLEWSDSLKEIQRNWIGRSEGAQIFFGLKGFDEKLEVFTTRADTIFGATFMVLAPEHALVGKIAAPEQREAVERYIEETKKRSERERMADTKRVSGQFTGAYAINPFNGTEIPIYISDYVLAGYGTGAIMAVPAHDSRDYAFAEHFDLPIIPVVEGGDLSVASYDAKAGRMINSDFLTGMDVKEAIPAMIAEVERRGFGSRRVNYRLRDAIFSRQRYWGEPFPIYYKDDIARPLAEDCLPLELPPIENFGPTAEGEPTADELKVLHKTIKKVTEDIENFSFNTSVSAFMICQNELGALKCTKRAVLEPLAVLIAPFAPHIAEEIWEKLGHEDSVFDARFPEYDERCLIEQSVEYPVSFNGKVRFKKSLPAALSPAEVEAAVLADPAVGKYTEGRTPKKVIVVPGKIVNIVL